VREGPINEKNTALRMNLTEFHSGYRVYSVEALNRIPYRLNSDERQSGGLCQHGYDLRSKV